MVVPIYSIFKISFQREFIEYTQKPKRGRIVNIISSQCVNTNSTVMAMNHPSVYTSLSDDSGG